MAKPPKISEIPQAWLEEVIPLLEDGGSSKVLWGSKAGTDWATASPGSSADDGLQHILATLRQPQVLGSQVVGMQDRLDQNYLDSWEFLCPHPKGTPVPLYVKIGLNHGKLHLWLISLHIDQGETKGSLEAAIAAYKLKKQK